MNIWICVIASIIGCYSVAYIDFLYGKKRLFLTSFRYVNCLTSFFAISLI